MRRTSQHASEATAVQSLLAWPPCVPFSGAVIWPRTPTPTPWADEKSAVRSERVPRDEGSQWSTHRTGAWGTGTSRWFLVLPLHFFFTESFYLINVNLVSTTFGLQRFFLHTILFFKPEFFLLIHYCQINMWEGSIPPPNAWSPYVGKGK